MEERLVSSGGPGASGEAFPKRRVAEETGNWVKLVYILLIVIICGI